MRYFASIKLLNYSYCSKLAMTNNYESLSKWQTSVLCCLNQKTLKRCISSSSPGSKENRRVSSSSNAITEQREDVGVVSIGEKVKQAGKDVSYLGIIVLGVGVTGIILFAIFRELFSSSSPNVVYSLALKRCKKDERVIEALGAPIKGFGEMSSRGRRRHVSFVNYENKDGVKMMRVKFYLQGSKRKATVHLEIREKDKHFRYLLVELEGFPGQTIILEDNRYLTDNKNSLQPLKGEISL